MRYSFDNVNAVVEDDEIAFDNAPEKSENLDICADHRTNLVVLRMDRKASIITLTPELARKLAENLIVAAQHLETTTRQ